MTGLQAGSFVVGTAGHIDHGKSTLVLALTKIDPDRLEEEKRRGMTIDLGFAYMQLPSGRRVGIVDVPGHRRFLKNMLAGVHGMDAVLLVIAADEGPMPQTREHLAIIDLLGIEHGVVVLTKADLVDEAWLGLVRDDVTALLAASSLRQAPIVAVSSSTGAGLDELRTALDAELAKTAPRPDVGRPRLPVDRSFAMSGFGTVVTGTLVGGTLQHGAELALLPAGRRVRIRGLQQHNRPVEEARPGSRTAVNLSGLDHSEVRRGDVLAFPGTLPASRRLDARLIVLPGVRFILRVPSPAATVAGGVIVDSAPRRHRRRDPAVLRDLAARERADPATSAVLELGKHSWGLVDTELAGRLGVSAARLETILAPLIQRGAVRRLAARRLTRQQWEQLVTRMLSVLGAYHEAQPLRRGMPKEELRSRLGVPAELFAELLTVLAADQAVVDQGGEVAAANHRPALSSEQETAISAFVTELEGQPFNPPPLPDLVRRYRLTPALLQYLVVDGRVVRVNEDTAFARSAYDDAVRRLRRHLIEHRTLTVAAARDVLGSSRRYVLPLLEWLDAQKVTRRVGDDRILRG